MHSCSLQGQKQTNYRGISPQYNITATGVVVKSPSVTGVVLMSLDVAFSSGDILQLDSLRPFVLQKNNSNHHGSTDCQLFTRAIVYWVDPSRQAVACLGNNFNYKNNIH